MSILLIPVMRLIPLHEVLSTYIVHIKCTLSSLRYIAYGPELGTEMATFSRDGCHLLLLGVVYRNMPARHLLGHILILVPVQ
jgi:hypothetical protein